MTWNPVKWVTGGTRWVRAKLLSDSALSLVGSALPIVTMLADLTVKVTPTGVDDAAWSAVKTKYPLFFSGKKLTADELKAAAMLAGSELLKAKLPTLDTTTARAAIQLAYAEYQSIVAAK